MMTAMSISAVADEALAFAGPARLPTRWGEFRMYAVSEPHTGKEHAMLVVGDDLDSDEPVLLRVHSECLTGDAFHSRRCDCGDQLERAMAVLPRPGAG